MVIKKRGAEIVTYQREIMHAFNPFAFGWVEQGSYLGGLKLPMMFSKVLNSVSEFEVSYPISEIYAVSLRCCIFVFC